MVNNYVIFITIAIFLDWSCTQVISQCIQKSPCSCVLPDGTGYDFSNLTKEGPLNITVQNITFWFQPCKDVPLSNVTIKNECNNKPVSLCTLNKNNAMGYVNLGTVAESKLELQSDHEQTLILVYKHNKFTTKINLVCCKNCPSTLSITKSLPSDLLLAELMLTSSEVCKRNKQEEGISSGSVFFILLIIFAGVYFIGGAFTLKLLRGATGWEMLPNHTFWCGLGRQIKNGFFFICRGCKEDSYEQI